MSWSQSLAKQTWKETKEKYVGHGLTEKGRSTKFNYVFSPSPADGYSHQIVTTRNLQLGSHVIMIAKPFVIKAKLVGQPVHGPVNVYSLDNTRIEDNYNWIYDAVTES